VISSETLLNVYYCLLLEGVVSLRIQLSPHLVLELDGGVDYPLQVLVDLPRGEDGPQVGEEGVGEVVVVEVALFVLAALVGAHVLPGKRGGEQALKECVGILYREQSTQLSCTV
jgi:hypothetical protein